MCLIPFLDTFVETLQALLTEYTADWQGIQGTVITGLDKIGIKARKIVTYPGNVPKLVLAYITLCMWNWSIPACPTFLRLHGLHISIVTPIYFKLALHVQVIETRWFTIRH